MEKSYSLWNNKRKNVVDQFIFDFKEYFKKNGFDVQEQNASIMAKYKGLTIKLFDINFDGNLMYIQGLGYE